MDADESPEVNARMSKSKGGPGPGVSPVGWFSAEHGPALELPFLY